MENLRITLFLLGAITAIVWLFLTNAHTSVNNELPYRHNTTPHIIFFVADDMGWNDAGWYNKDIYSPNLLQLAKEGIQLNHSYVLPFCSPSRSSLLTGYYSYRTGLQADVICGTRPFGLPTKFRTMADRMREQGYATHGIGKWNLGFCSWDYTPLYRGFDTYFGFYQSVEHFYSHTTFEDQTDPHKNSGYDFRNNTEVAWEYSGIHCSIPFTKQAKHIIESHDQSRPLFLYYALPYPHVPHEIPEEFENIYQNSSVKNVHRRKYMARISAMDYDVGEVISALKDHGLYENSVIAFTSDNGATPYASGNNHPLRGGKGTYYEGGTRVPAFIHSPLLKEKGFTFDGLMHAADWVPTLLAVAGQAIPDQDMDGINLWPAITKNRDSPRKEVVYNLIKTETELRGAIRVGKWKLIVGTAGTPSQWYLPEDVNGIYDNEYYEYEAVEKDETNSTSLQLFNLADDPNETTDLSSTHKEIVKKLLSAFKSHESRSVPPINLPPDPAGNPNRFGGVFTPGWCDAIIDPTKT